MDKIKDGISLILLNKKHLKYNHIKNIYHLYFI